MSEYNWFKNPYQLYIGYHYLIIKSNGLFAMIGV